MTEHDFTAELESTQNPDMRLIRHMFSTINNSVLSLASSVDKQNVKIAETNISVAKLETRVDCFHDEVSRHFATCPVEDLREHTGQIDIELERIRAAKKRPDSDDKISRPPKALAISDRTIQMLIVLCIIALGGAGLLVQIFGV